MAQGSRLTEGVGSFSKRGVPEGQYGVFLPSLRQEGRETGLRGGVTSADSRGAGDAPGLDRRELPSWEAGKVKPQAGSSRPRTSQFSVSINPASCWGQ